MCSGKPLSRAQVDVVRRILASPDRLLRFKGPGYWTTVAAADGWQTTTQTVRAMVRAGLLDRCMTDAEPFRDPRRLTDAGVQAGEGGAA